MARGIKSYLRYRAVNRITGQEITPDLPCLHNGVWSVAAMQPGNPGSAALGEFTIGLHPPGSRGYRLAKPIYDQLDRFIRIEAYLSGTGLSMGGAPRFAGPILDMPSDYGENGDSFELHGATDLYWANYSMPFPGELLAQDVTSNVLKSYLGTNEPSAANDTFNPFVAGNYTSTNLPGGSSGTWSGTTDDGFNVVSCSSGQSAVLLAKAGAAANDRWHSQYIEITGRMNPSADAGNAGTVGVGLSSANNSTNNSVVGYITAYKQNGRYNLNANILSFAGGSSNGSVLIPNALSNVDDPQGFIKFTIGLLVTASNGMANVALTVNGKVVAVQYSTVFSPGLATNYPLIHYSIPSSGGNTIYVSKLMQFTRFSADGASTAAAFAPGSITTSTHSLQFATDPGPSFLDLWSRLATREGWYWRYTPQAFTGSGGPPAAPRTLGTVDFAADPGSDLTHSVIIKRGENLVHLGLSGNADLLMSGTATAGPPSLDGGGLSFWRDIATMTKYGVIEDQSQAWTAPEFNALARYSQQIVSNKIAVGTIGSKRAVVLRDPLTADRWRELDRITIHDPEQNLNYQSARVLAYDFTEGDVRQNVVLDQFSAE